MQQQPIGVANLGNTCSISTCIQCMDALPSIRNAICQSDGAPACNMASEARHLLRAMHEEGRAQVMPSGLITAIHREGGALFPPGEQHDLCELWVWMLDRLHEQFAKRERSCPKGRDVLERAVLGVVHKHQNGRYSGLLEAIQGTQIAMVVCDHCGFRATNVEPFSLLPLDLEANMPVTEMLQNHMARVPLPDWKCDRCGKCGAARMVRLYHCPKVLVISLNRFFLSTKKQAMAKKACRVVVPAELFFHGGAVVSLKESDPPIRYCLRAAGNHFGSYGGGHYTASVERGGRWYHADDTSVEPYPDTESALEHIGGCAYMLFYERC